MEWGCGRPSPWTQSSPPPPKHYQSAVRGWEGWDVRGEAPPFSNDSLYRNTEEVGTIHACLILCLLLLCLVSFRAFSYSTYLYSATSPTSLNFTKRLLLWRLVSYSAFSYRAYLHSANSLTALIEWRRHGKKMQLSKDPVIEIGQALKKYFTNIIKLPLKNTLEFFLGLVCKKICIVWSRRRQICMFGAFS